MPSLPLLAISLLAYNLIVLIKSDQSLSAIMTVIELDSGADWALSLADMFQVFSLGLLFVELIRATVSGTATLVNHVLSMLVFVIALVEFLVAQGFGNSTFFLFLLMTLLDVIAGFIITAAATHQDRSRGAARAQNPRRPAASAHR